MFIDTLMALWNRVWYGKLKRVFVTSFLFGISIMLLLIMVGIPLLTHPSPTVSKRTVPFVDVADKKEDAVPIQPHLDKLSTPPPTPSLIPTLPTPPPAPPTLLANTQSQPVFVAKVPKPAIVIIAVRHASVPVAVHPAAKHKMHRVVRKDVTPVSTIVVAPVATSVPSTPVVATPTPALLPTPTITITTTPEGNNTVTPEASPAPMGTALPQLTALPTAGSQPFAPSHSW